MGSFSYTCALTRTGIEAGDRIWALWWKGRIGDDGKEEAFKRTTYDLHSTLYGIVNKETPGFLHSYYAQRAMEFVILRGEYDDYGGIECDDRSRPLHDTDSDHYFMVNEYVIEQLCKLKGLDVNGDPYSIMHAVAELAFCTRRELFGGPPLLGRQGVERVEIEEQIMASRWASHILNAQLNDIRRYERKKWWWDHVEWPIFLFKKWLAQKRATAKQDEAKS